jgi:hypothetical protein
MTDIEQSVDVNSPSDLKQYVNEIVSENTANKRNLEDYLLALLKQIQAAQDKQPSYQDLANFLRNSYTGEVAQYTKGWEKLPVLLSAPNTDASHKEMESYDYTERMLKIYIADLHYIRTSLRHAFFSGSSVDGVKGQGGKIVWQRTDVASFLTVGVMWLDGDFDSEPGYEHGGWHILESILTDGVWIE